MDFENGRPEAARWAFGIRPRFLKTLVFRTQCRPIETAIYACGRNTTNKIRPHFVLSSLPVNAQDITRVPGSPSATVAESSAAPLECKLFSLNVVPKPEMLSVRAEYVLSSLQVGITTPIVRTQAARSKRVARGLRPSSGGPARRPGASHRAARPASPFAPRP